MRRRDAPRSRSLRLLLASIVFFSGTLILAPYRNALHALVSSSSSPPDLDPVPFSMTTTTTTTTTRPYPLDSPVVDISHHLAQCDDNSKTLSPDADPLEIRVRGASPGTIPPLAPRDFVCKAQCPAIEPELETSARHLMIAKYTFASLWKLCERHAVPYLVRIDASGAASWRSCLEPDRRPPASSQWLMVRQLITLLSRTVALPKVVFAFDPEDFSRPHTSDPRGLFWQYTLPGIVRFVGDASHPSLLFPTLPFIHTTAFCAMGSVGGKKEWWEPCTWLPSASRALLEFETFKAKNDLVFWRGSPTGGVLDAFSPRIALNERFATRAGYDVGFTEGTIPPYADEHFVRSHVWKPRVSRSHFGSHKMVVSVDGHTASWGLVERLALGSVVLKQDSLRGYREFYYARLVPFKHYIPVAADWSDLDRARRWVLDEPRRAWEIARAASDLVNGEMSSPSFTLCYLYRLFATLASRYEPQGEDDAGLQWINVDEGL